MNKLREGAMCQGQKRGSEPEGSQQERGAERAVLTMVSGSAPSQLGGATGMSGTVGGGGGPLGAASRGVPAQHA